MLRVLFLGLMLLAACTPALAQLQINVQPGGQVVLGQAGIGAVLITRDGAPVISQVIAHGPAFGAGLKAQDTIVWVNYRDVAGMKLDQVVSLIRGPTGSAVAITVLHPGDPKPHTYTLTRAPIVIGGP
jgi:C-terminal processing protease CtpA/Prc